MLGQSPIASAAISEDTTLPQRSAVGVVLVGALVAGTAVAIARAATGAALVGLVASGTATASTSASGSISISTAVTGTMSSTSAGAGIVRVGITAGGSAVVYNTASGVVQVSTICRGAATVPVSATGVALVAVSASGVATNVYDVSDGIKTTVINTTTGGAAEYTDYNYNSFFRLGSAHYGCSDAGITLLDGTIPITLGWEISTAITDLGSAQIKYVPDSTVIIRTEGMVELAELVDEQIERTNMQVPCDGKAGLHGRRVLMPKGVHGTEWQFTWSGVGVAADIKEFAVNPVYSKRTVR